jgi:rRNA pseudouridine-1189 N-methylase Emg1 (Nep1/Mra1 family)
MDGQTDMTSPICVRFMHIVQRTHKREMLLLSNYALEYAIRKIQENKQELKMNGTHQLLVYAADDNLLGQNINIIKQNADVLLDVNREVGLEVNAQKTNTRIYSCLIIRLQHKIII